MDTITAIATPRGLGGVGVIRVSGVKSLLIAQEITKKKIKPGCIEYCSFFGKNGSLLDFGLSLYFKKPKSFTGEDVIEFHTHGNDLILDSLLFRIITLGARLAEPGEFTFRAFYNNKIDLLQAESINLLVKSKNLQHNHFILKSLNGFLSKEICLILDKLFFIRKNLNGFIEFPDDISFNFDTFFLSLKKIVSLFNVLLKKIYVNCLASDALRVAILGDVNVGKSSFFNLLLKKHRSIVSKKPGTTRDFIESDVDIGSLKVKLIDTAGLNSETNCFIEKRGILKSLQQIKEAAIIVFMFDVSVVKSDFLYDNMFKRVLEKCNDKLRVFSIKNKIDLCGLSEQIKFYDKYIEIYMSVKENKGIDLFINEVNAIFNGIKETSYMINKRHYSLILKAKMYLLKSIENCENRVSLDICSENIEKAYKNLSDIIGRNSSDDLIKSIFSDFCVGK